MTQPSTLGRATPARPPAASRCLALPWLTLKLSSASESLLHSAELALRRFAVCDGPGRLPPLRLRMDWATSASGEELWREGGVRYQFVRGEVEEGQARYVTADGSVVHLYPRARWVSAAVRPSTPSGPYSTWPDLLSAPLAEYWRVHGCFPLHAAAVDLDGRCVVLPAPSGAGKTTLCLALLRGGGAWRADDKLLLARRGDGTEMISLQRTTNLSPETIRRFEGLSFVAGRPPLDENNPKRAALMEEASERVDLSSFPPSALLFPRIARAPRSAVRALDHREALVRLAAQSPTSPLRSRLRAQVDALAALAAEVPALEIVGGADVLTRPEAVAELVRRAIVEAVR